MPANYEPQTDVGRRVVVDEGAIKQHGYCADFYQMVSQDRHIDLGIEFELIYSDPPEKD